jgi:Flp pilus assembly protein TadB
MDEQPSNQSSDIEARHRAMLQRSSVESDRKFWSGERPISIVQWLGLLLMFLALLLVASYNYRTYGVVFGAFVAFVVVGNRWARRKKSDPPK